MAKNSVVFDGTTEIHQTAEGIAIILTGGVLGSKQIRTTPRAGSKTDDIAKEALEQIQVIGALRILRLSSLSSLNNRQVMGHLTEFGIIDVITWVTAGEEVEFAIRREDDTLWIDLGLSKYARGLHPNESDSWLHEVSPGQFVPLDLMRSWCDSAVAATELLRSKIGAWSNLQIIVAAAEQPEPGELTESYDFSVQQGYNIFDGELDYDAQTQTAEMRSLVTVTYGQPIKGKLTAFVFVRPNEEALVLILKNPVGTAAPDAVRAIVEGWLEKSNIQLPVVIKSASA